MEEQINNSNNVNELNNEKGNDNHNEEKVEKVENNVVENNDNNIENNTNFNALDNPFEENYDNLLENIDFPEDDRYQNKFSNLRTSEIPMYFKTLRSKSIVEKANLNSNAPSTDIGINNNNNLINENSGEAQNNHNSIIGNNNTSKEQKENDIKKNTNINDLFNRSSNEYTSTFKNYRANPLLFQNKWKEKISSLNKWIKEGKNSQNFENLKEGIRQILVGLDEIEEIIINCAIIGDNDGRDKVSCIKSDMEQTCYRYECLIQGKKVEKFKSSFDGNVKKYYFYKPGLLRDNNIKIDDIEDEKKEKKEKKLKIFGTIKNGIIKVGKKIQSKSKDKKEKSDKKDKTEKKEKKDKKEKKMKELDNIGIIDMEHGNDEDNNI